MNLRFGHRTIRLRPFDALLLLAAVGGVALFVRLGFWQIDRAGEKRALLEQYAAGQQSTEALLPGRLSVLPRYQHVNVRGHYDATHQILLDNMPSGQGQPGYRVLTPFESDSGELLLVDRGWVPLGMSRAVLPQIGVESNARTVVGRVDELPQAGIRLGERPGNAAASWPRVMSFPRHEDIEQALGKTVVPRRVLLDPEQPDGYQRTAGLHLDFGPSRHIAYAVQWFALAVLVIAMLVVVVLKAPQLRP